MKENRTRQPIVCVLGHVDHGKTLLLDVIRGTKVQKGEAGGMTQHVGASFIPMSTIKKICGPMIEKMGSKITIPGLLFIDTPGHEAFTTLRKRGGSVADLAILVIDLNEGFQPQTEESLIFLKEFKTPFVIAATKIDRVAGWHPKKGSFLESFASQREDVKDDLERKVYSIVAQLAEHGMNAERFDRFEKLEDFTKSIAIVPCSGLTGEGVPDLLMVLTGLAQQFLKDELALSEKGRGTVLELKDVRGFGPTIDVILYDGTARKNDFMVIGGKKPIVTEIKALLRPRPLKELRVEKQFESVDEVTAAAGIKIAAPDLSEAMAGSPIIIVRSEGEVGNAKAELQKEIEEIEFEKDVQGIIVKADTLGGLEAMIRMMQKDKMPVMKADVGSINKQDLIKASNVKDKNRQAILAFNIHTSPEMEQAAKDLKVKIFSSNIIYHLIEDYKEWMLGSKKRELEEKIQSVHRPVKVKILKGCIFHAAKPCIVGVEVMGYLKAGVSLKNKDGKIVGKVKQIQNEGKGIESAKTGDRVAISMDEPVAGRTVNEGDTLVSALTVDEKKVLKEVYDSLSDDEKIVLNEI